MSVRSERSVIDLRGRFLPESARPAGYAALIERYELEVPLPPRMTAVAHRHHPVSTEAWQLLNPRRAPDDSLEGQLAFALKWEGVNLSVLAALFRVVGSEAVTAVVRVKPTGSYARRLWFLYEWLTGTELDLADPGKVRAVPIVDPAKQFALDQGRLSPRHKVFDNLPGTREFCPLVRRTTALENYAALDLARTAREVVGRTSADLMARAAAFLVLADSKASFAIEGERPSASRAARWGRVISEAGSLSLSVAELERLQSIVVGDARFVQLGLRTEGGFVGIHDRDSLQPIPAHVSARPEDLEGLVQGIVSFVGRVSAGNLDPVVAAASMAFGFVYVHPFEDGNGRVHRWLIHHALAKAGFNPPGVVFPVSAVMLREVAAYRAVLETYSEALLPCVHWHGTPKGNVEVENDTADHYRYFDATEHALFLYRCVEQTVQHDLPNEVAYLQAYDRFVLGVKALVEMPDHKIQLLHRFVRQGRGKLSKRARTGEFAAFSAEEVTRVEALYAECSGDLPDWA